MALTRTIRKYCGGGLCNLGDPGIPKARVEVYLRSAEGETFYVPTLYEGILHLLSNKGYRLGVYEWPDGADISRERYGIVVRRHGNELTVALEAPMVDYHQTASSGQLVWDFSKKPSPAEYKEGIQIESLNELLGLPEVEVSPEDLTKEVEVTIDGT